VRDGWESDDDSHEFLYLVENPGSYQGEVTGEIYYDQH
jgi:hypothetical protein